MTLSPTRKTQRKFRREILKLLLTPATDLNIIINMKVKLTPKLKCQRCGYQWVPRVSEVKACPKCKNVLWYIPREAKKTK